MTSMYGPLEANSQSPSKNDPEPQRSARMRVQLSTMLTLVLYSLVTCDEPNDCQATCLANVLNNYEAYFCQELSAACLCQSVAFGFALKDCSEQSCPAGTDDSFMADFVNAFCGEEIHSCLDEGTC